MYGISMPNSHLTPFGSTRCTQSEKVPYGTLVWASGIATRPVIKNLIDKIGKVCP